jgi:LemA protein
MSVLSLISNHCPSNWDSILTKGEFIMPNQVARFSLLLFLVSLLSGCGYNTFQSSDEEIKAAWAEVLNQYQRRADLVPNLVNVVKGYAAHEKDVLTQVTDARSRVGSINATPELINDEDAFKKFIAAQSQMSGALSRLMVVAENYPQLKADGMFRDLQAQLEGTENRITVARNRYIATVKDYNITVRSFPTNITAMIFGYKTKPSFTVENEQAIAVPPKVDFGTSAPTATPAPAPAQIPAPAAQPMPLPAPAAPAEPVRQ